MWHWGVFASTIIKYVSRQKNFCSLLAAYLSQCNLQLGASGDWGRPWGCLHLPDLKFLCGVYTCSLFSSVNVSMREREFQEHFHEAGRGGRPCYSIILLFISSLNSSFKGNESIELFTLELYCWGHQRPTRWPAFFDSWASSFKTDASSSSTFLQQWQQLHAQWFDVLNH